MASSLLSSQITINTKNNIFLPKSSTLYSFKLPKIARRTKIFAELGGGDDNKKFITREEEPEQYWQTAGERKGENPMMTPLPYIIIFGMSTPFVILAIAFANGWIKAPIR